MVTRRIMTIEEAEKAKIFSIGAGEDRRVQPGDRIQFELEGGERMEAIAVRREQGGMLFIFTDCLRKEYALHDGRTYPGWDKSELRGKLQEEVLPRFPEELRKLMIPFANGDLLRIPTEKEIFGENEYGEKEPDGVAQFEIMKDRRIRIADQGFESGTYEIYWLQNRGVDSASWAAFVYGYGAAYWGSASDVFGVRPLFIADL